MIIDHIGIVVRSLEQGIQQWETLFGYRKSSDIVLNPRQNVRVVFLSKPQSLIIKLIEPAGSDSPVFLFAHKGGGLHHLCFRCENLNSQLAEWAGKEVILKVPPEPGEAFDGNPIAFLAAKNNLLIELIDTPKKAGWRESV
jgi:methylmalonyl-CoA/ethylmalonyl-CoA epimerase